MIKKLNAWLIRKMSPRVELDLFKTLSSMHVHFDLREMTNEQLTYLLVNNSRLVEGILSEMQERDMPVSAIMEGIQKSVERGNLKNDKNAGIL